MTLPVGEDSRRLAWRCGGRNGRYRGEGGRRALFVLLLLMLPVCFFYAIIISAVFLPFLVVRALMKFASLSDNLGFLRIFPSLRDSSNKRPRIIEKRV